MKQVKPWEKRAVNMWIHMYGTILNSCVPTLSCWGRGGCQWVTNLDWRRTPNAWRSPCRWRPPPGAAAWEAPAQGWWGRFHYSWQHPAREWLGFLFCTSGVRHLALEERFSPEEKLHFPVEKQRQYTFPVLDTRLQLTDISQKPNWAKIIIFSRQFLMYNIVIFFSSSFVTGHFVLLFPFSYVAF